MIDGAHDGHLGVRPGEDTRGAERPGIRRGIRRRRTPRRCDGGVRSARAGLADRWGSRPATPFRPDLSCAEPHASYRAWVSTSRKSSTETRARINLTSLGTYDRDSSRTTRGLLTGVALPRE